MTKKGKTNLLCKKLKSCKDCTYIGIGLYFINNDIIKNRVLKCDPLMLSVVFYV